MHICKHTYSQTQVSDTYAYTLHLKTHTHINVGGIQQLRGRAYKVPSPGFIQLMIDKGE